MLPLMLMLVADPLASSQAAEPSVRIIDAEATMQAVDQAADGARRECRNGEYQRADDGTVRVGRTTPGRPSAPGLQRAAPTVQNDLMFRQGDPVSLTLLVERQIDGCSVPISYDAAPDGRLPSFPARAD